MASPPLRPRPPPRLIIDMSPVPKSRWHSFMKDDQTHSYSYHLPFRSEYHDGKTAPSEVTPVAVQADGVARAPTTTAQPQPPPPQTVEFSPRQLDDWFERLRPATLGVASGNAICSENGHGARAHRATSEDGAERPHPSAWTDAQYKGSLLLRKTAWCVLHPACECEYGYSDTWQKRSTSPELLGVLREATAAVETVLGLPSGELNCVNLNYYPRGGGVGFHADDESLFDGLNRDTRIVSLSLCSRSPGIKGDGGVKENGEHDFGARRFQVRPKKSKKAQKEVQEIILRHGDLITMEGMFQRHYLHSVWPGDSRGYEDHPLTQGERINLTWRTVVRHLHPCPLAKKPNIRHGDVTG